MNTAFSGVFKTPLKEKKLMKSIGFVLKQGAEDCQYFIHIIAFADFKIGSGGDKINGIGYVLELFGDLAFAFEKRGNRSLRLLVVKIEKSKIIFHPSFLMQVCF